MTEVVMGGFTKLFSRILTSSVWSESNEVRITWITLLAATGPDGLARVTLPGLSRLANLPLEQTERAVAVLGSPDKYSRTVENEGRRIREERDPAGNLVGYYVFNYQKHRAVDATAAARKRRQRQRVTRDRHARQKTEDRSTRRQKAEVRDTTSVALATAKRTWLTPYSEDWTERYGGTPPHGEMAKTLQPLEKTYGAAHVRSNWRFYLAQTEARFASPSRFAQTFGSWGTQGDAPVVSKSEQRSKAALSAFLAKGEQ